MKDRTLVTGFGPFLDVQDNPSTHLAAGSGRPHHILEVSYDCVEDFIFHLDPESFDRLLLVGVAPSRAHITPEMFARNTYGIVGDVRGNARTGAIQDGAPLLLGGTLWDSDVISEIVAGHLTTLRISLDAGAYLCNFTYYKALSAFPSKKVGFLHVPMPDKVPLERQAQVLEDILDRLESD